MDGLFRFSFAALIALIRFNYGHDRRVIDVRRVRAKAAESKSDSALPPFELIRFEQIGPWKRCDRLLGRTLDQSSSRPFNPSVDLTAISVRTVHTLSSLKSLEFTRPVTMAYRIPAHFRPCTRSSTNELSANAFAFALVVRFRLGRRLCSFDTAYTVH
jgi:hypothetical protein